jgi:hypothetical protein
LFGRKKKELLEGGTRAKALITQVEDTGVKINGVPRVKLTLQVQPDGGLPFEATKKVTLSGVWTPVVGETTWVRYDPSDAGEVELDEAQIAQPVATTDVNVAGLGTTETQVTINGQPVQVNPGQVSTFFSGGANVIDARGVPGLREELLGAVSDVQAGGNPAELQQAVMKAMQQGRAMAASAMPPAMPAAPGMPATSGMPGIPGLPGQPDSGEDPLDRLEKLNALRESGALTQAEFDAQKKKLLEEM